MSFLYFLCILFLPLLFVLMYHNSQLNKKNVSTLSGRIYLDIDEFYDNFYKDTQINIEIIDDVLWYIYTEYNVKIGLIRPTDNLYDLKNFSINGDLSDDLLEFMLIIDIANRYRSIKKGKVIERQNADQEEFIKQLNEDFYKVTYIDDFIRFIAKYSLILQEEYLLFKLLWPDKETPVEGELLTK